MLESKVIVSTGEFSLTILKIEWSDLAIWKMKLAFGDYFSLQTFSSSCFWSSKAPLSLCEEIGILILLSFIKFLFGFLSEFLGFTKFNYNLFGLFLFKGVLFLGVTLFDGSGTPDISFKVSMKSIFTGRFYQSGLFLPFNFNGLSFFTIFDYLVGLFFLEGDFFLFFKGLNNFDFLLIFLEGMIPESFISIAIFSSKGWSASASKNVISVLFKWWCPDFELWYDGESRLNNWSLLFASKLKLFWWFGKEFSVRFYLFMKSWASLFIYSIISSFWKVSCCDSKISFSLSVLNSSKS